MDRNVFPPTPPPEAEKSAASGSISRGASVRNGNRPMPPRLDVDKARPADLYEVTERRESPQSAQARLGTQRTASEPRGPSSRQGLKKSDSRSRPRRRLSEDDEIVDEYPGELYDMYRNSRNGRAKRNQPRYIEEEDEDASDYDDGSFDEGEFEMVSSRPPVRSQSRATSSSGRGQSRRPELRKIRVKVHADDVRYLMIGPAIEFPDFTDRIREKFGLRKRFKVTVRDDDLPGGDMVTLGDQDDLDVAIQTVKTNARKERLDMGKMEVSYPP
jgi:hypothetical protein